MWKEPYSGLFSRHEIFAVFDWPRTSKFSASKSLFTVGVWSNEPLSSKIKSTKCLVWAIRENFSASKITRHTVVDLCYILLGSENLYSLKLGVVVCFILWRSRLSIIAHMHRNMDSSITDYCFTVLCTTFFIAIIRIYDDNQYVVSTLRKWLSLSMH